MKAKKRNKSSIDLTLLVVTLLLISIGLIMIFSASWPEGMEKFEDEYFFIRRQALFAILGLGEIFIASIFPYKKIEKLSGPIFLVALVLCLLIFTPLGRERNNARRWLYLGIEFMPSDIMKLASIIFLSARLKCKKTLNGFFSDLVPMLIWVLLPCGLILLQKDLSTTITLAGSLMSMIFIAGMKISHLILMLILGFLALVLAIIDKDNAYRMVRIKNYTDPFANLHGGGWQVANSLMALGTGGIFGSGIGKSRQKFFYLPEAQNDFIFAIIGEELGLVGGIIILTLFSILIARGVTIAVKSKDPFARYMATGITALIAIQSLINLGVVTGLIPPTGIPLPFISYGGTSLLVNMASIGILLNLSRYTE